MRPPRHTFFPFYFFSYPPFTQALTFCPCAPDHSCTGHSLGFSFLVVGPPPATSFTSSRLLQNSREKSDINCRPGTTSHSSFPSAFPASPHSDTFRVRRYRSFLRRTSSATRTDDQVVTIQVLLQSKRDTIPFFKSEATSPLLTKRLPNISVPDLAEQQQAFALVNLCSASCNQTPAYRLVPQPRDGAVRPA